MIGDAPFDGPCACVRVARDITTGDFICNPTYEEQENSDLDLIIAGTADYISMIEAGAKEISEEDMLAAMQFGQTAIAKFCEAQQRFLDRCNIEKREWPIHQADPAIAERIEPFAAEMSAALKDADKQARMGKVEELKARIKEEQFSEEEARKLQRKMAKNQFDYNDFFAQIQQIKKMGNIKDLMAMIPGIGKAVKDLDIDDNAFKSVEAIIHSMTPKERANPDIINNSRKERIARGSGNTLQEVNRIVKQFEQIRKTMKNVAGGKMPNMAGMMRGKR
jgi:polyribonucleotide nucleotidyltransferase